MNNDKFLELIAKGEKPNVDFKIECRAFLHKGDKLYNGELAKDICAMANNKKASYIIIGVSDDGKGFKTVLNSKLTDDNLQGFCRDAIYPPPKIKLSKLRYKKTHPHLKDKRFVIIQIGPHPRQVFHLNQDFIDYQKKVCFRRYNVLGHLMKYTSRSAFYKMTG